MTTRIVLSVLIATLLTGVSTTAQSPSGQAPLASRFVDPVNGLSLEQVALVNELRANSRWDEDLYVSGLTATREDSSIWVGTPTPPPPVE